jgi:hypothetical protein
MFTPAWMSTKIPRGKARGIGKQMSSAAKGGRPGTPGKTPGERADAAQA